MIHLDVAHPAQNRLHKIFGQERWHKSQTGGWIGDAIYGVNDGLGAIFGIIAGVAGYTSNVHIVLVSGLFGALASTLSMGAGAWLASKSESELEQQELAHEMREIRENPEHEIEELALLYQLKGFNEAEADAIAHKIATDESLFVKTMAQEELGIQETESGSHWKSAFVGSLSTLVGGLVPLIPFLFASGILALILAAAVSIVAHFAVGALKTLVTARRWWTSGLEMTMAGIIVGVVAYGLGLLGTTLVHI
ncbi:VIT1/CCC1 transporter family protein [Alicyclobacillus sp. SP_1]|uniref:VIT1/CCC1 transporter family protein n=1 Tax=Alicyclobacillus sp. SP_1 TaxID=2942475 RepID=UPI002157CB75|nr:VIT1/CCC1 transporter family protein [Alicyclobacillus sp. SP_1]